MHGVTMKIVKWKLYILRQFIFFLSTLEPLVTQELINDFYFKKNTLLHRQEDQLVNAM